MSVDLGEILEKVNWSGRRVRRMADPIAPSRMMTCGGCDDVVEVVLELVAEWDKGKSMTDLLGSTF